MTAYREGKTTCVRCGCYITPVGDFKYGVCHNALEDKCSQARLVPIPGIRQCLYEELKQIYSQAKYSKHYRTWLIDGRCVERSVKVPFHSLSHDHNKLYSKHNLAWFGTYGLCEFLYPEQWYKAK